MCLYLGSSCSPHRLQARTQTIPIRFAVSSDRIRVGATNQVVPLGTSEDDRGRARNLHGILCTCSEVKNERARVAFSTMSQIPGTEVRKSPIHGRGLYAVKALPEGCILGEYQGRTEPYRSRSYVGHWTLRRDHPDGTVELRNGRYQGNDLRYVNHSSNPNLHLDGWLFVTSREIKPGEELTLNYGFGWP